MRGATQDVGYRTGRMRLLSSAANVEIVILKCESQEDPLIPNRADRHERANSVNALRLSLEHSVLLSLLSSHTYRLGGGGGHEFQDGPFARPPTRYRHSKVVCCTRQHILKVHAKAH